MARFIDSSMQVVPTSDMDDSKNRAIASVTFAAICYKRLTTYIYR
ncbi:MULTISPECIES: hypothetical protein [unclassified Coleofasciculus]|nr:hypothetical protein [Coleofasciculus sp. FACHB-542]